MNHWPVLCVSGDLGRNQLEKPGWKLSRISEGKAGIEKCLCYHWLLSIKKFNNIGLVSKALVNHQKLLPRAGLAKTSLNVSVKI